MIPGAFNFRDLGGIPVAGGEIAARRCFRSDLLHREDAESARALLRDLGVVRVVDLRVADERRDDGAFDACEHIEALHVPILDAVWDWEEEHRAVEDTFLRDRTIEMLDHRGPFVVAALRAVAEAPPGSVVFHCTAGKDRTGVVAAALLGVLGADDEVIVADYARSAAAMPRIIEWYRSLAEDLPVDPEAESRLLARAATPATMAGVTDHVRRTYGGFAAWAATHGFGPDAVARLRQRLVV